MTSEYWLWASWIEKVMLYASMAFVIGGSFTYVLLSRYLQLRKTILYYMFVGAVLGAVASITSFFIQVGSFANNGLAGMFDPTFLKILQHSPVGTVQMTRTLCFVIIAAILTVKISRLSLQTSEKNPSWLSRILILLAALVVVASFSQLGHVTNLSFFAQILISTHIFVMSMWMGALFPLWRLSRMIEGMPLKESMHLFGQIASMIVGLLIICGLTIAIMLLKNIHVLMTTPYGHGFFLKLVLVGSILLLAAFNKWYFTPRLEHPQFAKQLSYAILFEMSLGLSILLVTGYITSVIGIE